MKKVIIARDSTIPHYRVPFYNALEKLRPDTWEFKVVFDPSEIKQKRFFKEELDINKFCFPILESKTYSIKLKSKRISYQPILRALSEADLIILENAVNNLAYPISHLTQLRGVKVAYWGIGRDMNLTVIKPTPIKLMTEKFKLYLSRKADGFFAYSNGVKSYLVEHGVAPNKIFVLNNTIDIMHQRTYFNRYHSERNKIREQLGLQGCKVLLFVGRLTKDKKIDLLLESFSFLEKKDPDFRLIIVGGGDQTFFQNTSERVIYKGTVTNLDELGPIYVVSDLFVFPAGVGLGPIQAFCYDLPLITIQEPLIGPEAEYLSPTNSIILPEDTSSEEYADQILELFYDRSRLENLRASTWHSISHLTIDQMAHNFIHGVNTLLGLD
jgi:glycosyltransferase involved in cell wall biosynthesis